MKSKMFSVFPVLCLCVIGFVTPYTLAADQEEGVTDTQAQSREILMNMGKFLSQAQSFSVNILSGYDVVQESGQKIEFVDNRKVLVNRPDRLRIEVEKSDGTRNLAVFDGKNINISSTTQEGSVYAEAPSPGNLDAAVSYFRKDLHMRLPLALLLVSQLPTELDSRVEDIDYVEKTNIFKVPTHHLVGSTDTVDFQVWIKDGNQPLPLRIVLTYRNEEGQPQFRAQFSEWNLAPKIKDALFTFTPPDGAKKINFLARLNEMGIKGKAPATTAGEQP